MGDDTVRAEVYRPMIRALDGLIRAAQWLNVPIGRLDQDTIIEAAKRSTGLEDMGDPSFLKPMEKLLANARRAPFTSLGQAFTQMSCQRAVSNRLRIEQYLKAHKEVLSQTIRRPIFILGFPRTGTTLLQNLIAQAPNRRALEFWELTMPVPVHEDPAKDRAKRIRKADQILRAAYLIAPEQQAMHEVRSTTAEECWPLFINTFSVLNVDLQSGMTDYGEWLLNHDMTGPYREYERQLKLLQHLVPEQDLLLKCPEHLWFLDALLEVFPDACIVWTHRDPFRSVASYCSLISIAWRSLYGRFDPHDVGTHIEDRFLRGVERAMKARDAYGDESRFFDVEFSDLVHNPIDVVHKINDHFQLGFDDSMDASMEAWLQNKRSDKRGSHKYSAERYGLSPERVNGKFQDYIDRFNIQLGPVKG